MTQVAQKQKDKPAWWMVPAIVTGSVAALGALGTLAINYATYATLPEKVEAGEAKNVQQDESISKLTAIQETWQDIYQAQQKQIQQPLPENLPLPSDHRYKRVPYSEVDEEGVRWCCDGKPEWCDNDGGWWRC